MIDSEVREVEKQLNCLDSSQSFLALDIDRAAYSEAYHMNPYSSVLLEAIA